MGLGRWAGAALALGGLLAAAGWLQAQEPSQLEPGQRVRVIAGVVYGLASTKPVTDAGCRGFNFNPLCELGNELEPVGHVVLTSVVGALAGALLGGAIGGGRTAEAWRRVPRDRVRPTVEPASGGRTAIGLSVRF